MTSLIAGIAILSVVALSALTLSIVSFVHAQAVLRARAAPAEPKQEQRDAALEQMRTSLETLASQVRDLQMAPSVPGTSNYRPALNLSKRSQALRMHRRGDSVAQIAEALELPLQEVELLIKVHRIVLSKL